MRFSVPAFVIAVAFAVSASPAFALSCNELQTLIDAKEASLQAGNALPHGTDDPADRAAVCGNARETLEIKKKIIRYNSFAKRCGKEIAYKQHQDIGPDLIKIDRGFLDVICNDRRP